MQNFDLQPELFGEMLLLRPLRADDFDSLYSVASDPLVWEQHPERNRYERDIFQKFFQGALDSKGALLVLDAKTDEVIGSSRFTGLDMESGQVEVGYTFLARGYWGKGYNAEMKKLMLAHAFQYVDRVVFHIGEKNFRSRRAIEKIGARLLEKIERQPTTGAKYFSVIYGIERSSWREKPIAKQNTVY